jgi:hypothetical protein
MLYYLICVGLCKYAIKYFLNQCILQTVEHVETEMTAEEVHSELVKENILPLKIETQEDAVKAASAEVIEAMTIGVAQEAGVQIQKENN